LDLPKEFESQTDKSEDQTGSQVILTSNAAKSISEMILDAVENNNNQFANALLHELEDVSHDGEK